MKLMNPQKWLSLVVIMAALPSSCLGSGQADDTVAGPVETAVIEVELTMTTVSEVLPEFADAIRPSFDVPAHSDYSDPVQAVVETYLNLVRAQLYAFGAPEVDPEYGSWLELTTGKYQEKTSERMEEWRSNNWVQVLPEDTSTLTNAPVLRPGAYSETEGAIIGIDDCYVNTTTVVDVTTGELVGSDPV